jgi:hypothetical protein
MDMSVATTCPLRASVAGRVARPDRLPARPPHERLPHTAGNGLHTLLQLTQPSVTAHVTKAGPHSSTALEQAPTSDTSKDACPRRKGVYFQTAVRGSAADSMPERSSRTVTCAAPSLQALTLGPVSVRKPPWFRGDRRAVRRVAAGCGKRLFAGPFGTGGAERVLLAMQKVWVRIPSAVSGQF